MSLYVPAHFATQDRASVVRLMHDYPFASLITPADSEPLITHLPLVHVADCEPHGTLLGHFARANPHSRSGGDTESLALFHGPHAYVTPSWYGDPAASVPTWNYAVVHAHGAIQLALDPAETRAILDVMITRFESLRAAPWTIGLEPDRLQAMVGSIIGFRLRIKRLEAKFKLSQNRSREDRVRVADGLAESGSAEGEATAAWMRAYGDAGSTPDGTD
jgi:transcriptional regulator